MAEALAKALGAMNQRVVYQNESTTYPSMSGRTKQLINDPGSIVVGEAVSAIYSPEL